MLVAVQAGAFAIASSARGAIIPRIVEPELVPAANTLNFTVGNVGQVLGPLFAGALVGLHNGYAYAYGIDAIMFTAALYSALRLPPLPPDPNASTHARPALGRRGPALHRHQPGAGHVVPRRHRRDGAGHAARAVPRGRRPPVRRQRRSAVRGDRDRLGRRGAVQRMDRPGRAAGSRADLRHRRVGRRRRVRRAGAATVARRAAARSGRRRRPDQRRLPADDPADLRAGRDARTHAGRVHRRRRGRPAPRRPARGRDRCSVPRRRSRGSAAAIACVAVVLVAGILVRPFWTYRTDVARA